jgi:site-specific recombinase XerD
VLRDIILTAAAILISNNMDVQSVAGVLGHADPTTTLNIYSYFFKRLKIEKAL